MPITAGQKLTADLLVPIIAQMRQTVAQSISTSSGTAVTFGAEDVDTAGGHSTSSNTSRYVAQVAGWYQVSGAVSFASNGTGRRGSWLAVNGSNVNGSEAIVHTSTTNVISVPGRTMLVQLGIGDYVELLAWQDSGGSINTAVSGTQMSTMTVVLAYRT